MGDLELNYERLEVVFDSGLTIFTYTADPGTRSAEALGLLGSLAATTPHRDNADSALTRIPGRPTRPAEWTTANNHLRYCFDATQQRREPSR